jgi:maleylpyruvate isomerase
VTDHDLQATLAGCAAAHRRLEALVAPIDDAVVRRPSHLPDWTVGHVLTHIARNAESHVRILEGALAGRAVEQYPGGYEQRNRDIEAGAGRTAAEIRSDVRVTNAALEAAWARMTPGAWQGHGLARGSEWSCLVLPFHRWREVEVHCVDLGLGYSPVNWPEEYVERELPLALASLPDRIGAAARADLLAWLFGRAGQPSNLELAPWQSKPEYYHRP